MTQFHSQIENYITGIIDYTPAIINEQNYENNKKLEYRNDFYNIKTLIDEFLEKETKKRFLILPGLRGVGKTTILFQLYDYLLNNKGIESDRILLFSAERLKDFPNANIQEAFDYFIEEINQAHPLLKEKVFIFVDEAQYAKDWSLAGKIIYDENKKVFIIFTGSSALDLEINIDATRRAIRKPIYPLNFQEYLKLKYNLQIPPEIANELLNLIVNEKFNKIINLEKTIYSKIFTQLDKNPSKEWEYFLKYGGLPLGINESPEFIINGTIDVKNRVIEKDMDFINSTTLKTKLTAYKILNQLAYQNPGTISENKLSKQLSGTSKKSINTILSTFDKTHLTFHIEAYGNPLKGEKKPFKYYFTSTSLKYALISFDTLLKDDRNILGPLTENIAAATLHRIQDSTRKIKVFYPPEKGGVDFIINTKDGKIIPIEVGIGQKDTKQIKKAIKTYNAEYGIIISNRSPRIKKEIVDGYKIISIPILTFALM